MILDVKEENKVNGDKNNLFFTGPFKFVKSLIRHDKSIQPTTSMIIRLNKEIFQLDLTEKQYGVVKCSGSLGNSLALVRSPFAEQTTIFIRKYPQRD